MRQARATSSAWQEVLADSATPPIAFKDEGVYLITGGLGSLGLLFAREILAKTHQSHAVLPGRLPLSSERHSLLDALSTEPGRLSYRQLDPGNLDQVTQLMADIHAEYGQLKGILHSAGQIADNFILKKGSAEFSVILAPKVTGTFNLDQASQQVARSLIFSRQFSLVAGAIGNLGASRLRNRKWLLRTSLRRIAIGK